MRTTMRAAATGLLAAALLAAAGCVQQNVIVEQLEGAHGRYDSLQTQVVTGAALEGDTLRLVANGDNYYYHHDYYYDPYPFYGPFYTGWDSPYWHASHWHSGRFYYGGFYRERYLSEAYYYEIFLTVSVDDFPPKGEKRTLSPQEVSLVYARLDEGTVLTRLAMDVLEAEAGWDDDKPRVRFEARHRREATRYLQREGETGEPGEADEGPAAEVRLILAGTRVRGTLVAPLSAERVRQVRRRFDELGIRELMQPQKDAQP